jgi:hypothetical protein
VVNNSVVMFCKNPLSLGKSRSEPTLLATDFSPDYVLRNGITSLVLHTNSKLQGAPKSTNLDLEILRQSLEPQEPLITADHPITVLLLSSTEIAEDQNTTGLNFAQKHGNGIRRTTTKIKIASLLFLELLDITSLSYCVLQKTS